MEGASQRPPYGAYAAILGTFTAGLAGAGLLSRALDRNPQCQSGLDLVVLAAATFKAARTLSRDQITSPLRQPFVRGDAYKGEDEEPLPTGGFEQAIGELVTCTRCVGTWAAAGLATTQVIAPRFGRLLTWSLGAAAANDFLQTAFVALAEKSNELQERTG